MSNAAAKRDAWCLVPRKRGVHLQPLPDADIVFGTRSRHPPDDNKPSSASLPLLDGPCVPAPHLSLADNIKDGNENSGARSGRRSLVRLRLRSCWVVSLV